MKSATRQKFLLCVGYLLVIAILGLLAGVISPHDPLTMDTDRVLQPPSSTYWLGTDEFGRDILSRLLYGIRPSLTIALFSTLLAMVPGVILGILAGFYRRGVEQFIMRLADTILCFPPIILALVVVGFLGTSVLNLILVIGLLYIPNFVRLAYASTLNVMEVEYISATRALGAHDLRLILRHVLPNILSPVFVQAGLTVASAIMLESGLSFLGLGIPAPQPSWGLMIGAAKGYLAQSPTYVIWPSIAVASTIFVLNALSDGLRDFFDPRTRHSA